MRSQFDITELNRRLSNMICLGTIIETDYESAVVRVKIGDIVTAWLPWLERRAGNNISWQAPELSEQVIVLSPSGELNQGVVLRGLYQDTALPPVTSPHKDHMTYADGAVIEYDREAHHLKAILPEGATTELVSSGGIRVVGDVLVEGDITSTKEITDHKRSMSADRGIYNGHDHTGDSGGSTSTPGAQQ